MIRLLLVSCFSLSLIACQNAPITSLTPAVPTNKQIKQVPGFFKFSNSQSVFPIKQGFNWNYQVKVSSAEDPYTVKNGSLYLSTEKVVKQGQKTQLQLRMIDSFSNRYRFPTISMSPDSIYVKDVTFIGVGGVDAPGFSSHFLPLPLKADQRTDDGQWISKVQKQETIRVPDGTYDTWKIEVIGTQGYDYTVVGNYWISPGVGIVKSDVTLPGGWSIETVLESAYAK